MRLSFRPTLDHDGVAPFGNEQAAYDFVERCIWPEGPICPHCGSWRRIRRLRGQSTRPGTYKCYDCRKPFTVKINTILESSNLPMHKWLQAIVLIHHKRNQVRATELHRTLGVARRTANHVICRVTSGEGEDAIDPDRTDR
jgi:transposase-like protein